MIFKIGRDNFALTVMVPYDCGNNCAFCTTKDIYHGIDKDMGTCINDVKFQMERTLHEFSYPIKDVVFTGGEPTSDLDVLRELIDIIPADKNVYINTTLPSNEFDEFHDLVNDYPKIKGINVSRHQTNIDDDRKFYDCDIVGDEALKLIKKPVRINVVVMRETEDVIEDIVNRWEPMWTEYGNVNVCFRANFALHSWEERKMQKENLHNPYTPFLNALSSKYRFAGHTQCNVCDTTRFLSPKGMVVSYHRGLEESSVLAPDGSALEINDLVIFPDGRIGYDWKDISLKTMHECEIWFSHMNGLLSKMFDFNEIVSAQPAYSCGGGGSGCGGPVYGSCGGSGLPLCGAPVCG